MMSSLVYAGTAVSTQQTGALVGGLLSGPTALVNTTAQSVFGQFGLLVKGAAALSTWQIALITGAVVIVAGLVIGAVTVFIIRLINSKEVHFATASGGKHESTENSEDNEKSEQGEKSEEVEYDTYLYYEGNPIATSRSSDLYHPTKELPPRLTLREPSDKIKLLQMKLFFEKEDKVQDKKENQPPPKLVHLTKDRPRPPGRLRRR